MAVYTEDIHSNGERAYEVPKLIDSSIKRTKVLKKDCLKLIVGYGSTSGKHVIKSCSRKYLENLKKDKKIKDYICGGELSITNKIKSSFMYWDLIPDIDKFEANQGVYFVIV